MTFALASDNDSMECEVRGALCAADDYSQKNNQMTEIRICSSSRWQVSSAFTALWWALRQQSRWQLSLMTARSSLDEPMHAMTAIRYHYQWKENISLCTLTEIKMANIIDNTQEKTQMIFWSQEQDIGFYNIAKPWIAIVATSGHQAVGRDCFENLSSHGWECLWLLSVNGW